MNPDGGKEPGRLRRLGRFLSSAGKKILPAVVGMVAGVFIGPAAAPIAQFIASKLAGAGVSIDPKNIEDLVGPLLKESSNISVRALLEETIKKYGNIDDNKVSEAVAKGIPQIEERLTLAINAALRPTLDALREAVQFVQESPSGAIEELREMTQGRGAELSADLISYIRQINAALETKIAAGFESVMLQLNQIGKDIWSRLDELSNQLTTLMKQLTELPSQGQVLTTEMALHLCAEQVDSEPILSRYDERFDLDRYVNRTDAERELFQFLSRARTPVGLRSNIFVLLAGLGIGKTWLLGYLANKVLTDKSPVLFFELRHGDVKHIENSLGAKSWMDAYTRIDRLADATEKPVLIILDGFDEMPAGDRRTLINWVLDAKTRLGYQKIVFILSSRDYDWQSDLNLKGILQSYPEMFYNGNPLAGSFHLHKFDELQLKNAATNYGILADIQQNSVLKELASYPFILKLLGQFKRKHGGAPLPDPNNLEEFLPLFYDPDNESETILGRMGIAMEVLSYLGGILECCTNRDLVLNINKAKSNNLYQDPHLTLLFSTGLFIRKPGLRETIKINPLYYPLIKELMRQSNLKGIEQPSEIAAQSPLIKPPLIDEAEANSSQIDQTKREAETQERLEAENKIREAATNTEKTQEKLDEEVHETIEEEVQKEEKTDEQPEEEEEKSNESPYMQKGVIPSLFPFLKTPVGIKKPIWGAKEATYIYLNRCLEAVMRLTISQMPRIEKGERKGQLRQKRINEEHILNTITKLKITPEKVSKVKSNDPLIKSNSLPRLLKVEGQGLSITSDAREIIFKLLYEVGRIALFTLVDSLPKFEGGKYQGLFKKITIKNETVEEAKIRFDKFLKGEYFPPLNF